MGACCGKGSKVKDPDNAPYGATSPSQESVNKKSSPGKKTKPINVPKEVPTSSSVSPKHNLSTNTSSPLKDNGSLFDSAKPVVEQGVRTSGKKPIEVAFDPEPNLPTESEAEEAGEQPPRLPLKTSQRSIENLTAADKPAVDRSSNEAAVPDLHRDKLQSSLEPTGGRESSPETLSLPPRDHRGKDKGDNESFNTSSSAGNQSLDSSGVGEIDVPQVELHIDEAKLGDETPTSPPPPLPPKEKSPVSPKKFTPARRKGSVDAPFKQEVPDPLRIIENVRNRSKEGGYSTFSPDTTLSPPPKPATSGNIQSSPKLPEKKSKIAINTSTSSTCDKENDSSMAILGALKMIKESDGKASVQKEETKTVITKILTTDNNKDGKNENEIKTETESFVTDVKVERTTKIITSSSSEVTSSFSSSRIPLSPLRKNAPKDVEPALKKVEINGVPSPLHSPKSPVLENNPLHSPKSPVLEINPMHSPKSPVLENNNVVEKTFKSIETKVSSINEEIKEKKEEVTKAVVNGTAKSILKVEKHISFSETAPASVSASSSEESLSDTSPLDDGPGLLDIKKDAILHLLPNFHQANLAVMSRSDFCHNTRITCVKGIDQWMEGELPNKDHYPRTMMIKSAPGMGKSAILKQTCSKYGLQLAARHFFCYNSENMSHNYVRDVVLYVVFQLLEKLENYIRCLPSTDKIKHVIKYGSLDDILNVFFYEPLKNEYQLDHDGEIKMLVVLDALDECKSVDQESLFQFVDSFDSKMPSWMYLLVSIKDDNRLTSRLNNVHAVEVKNNTENMTDMKRMMKEQLGHFMDRISLDGGLTQLAKKTHGSALCAALYNNMLQQMDKDKKIALREIEAKFPSGLNLIIESCLKQFKQSLESENDAKQKYNLILGALCFAQEPMDAKALLEHIGIKDSTKVLTSLSVILGKNREGCVFLYHKSIAEWLLSDNAGNYKVEVNAPKTTIARYCMEWVEPVLEDSNKPLSPLARYSLKHSVAHLIDGTKQQENLERVLCNVKLIEQLLKTHRVDIYDVMKLYKHNHVQLGGEKPVTLDNYLSKFPKVAAAINVFKSFIFENCEELKFSPESLTQLAANFDGNERIQQNARVELGSSPWLEDLSLVSQTPHTASRIIAGKIEQVDISADGKTIALVTNVEDSIMLHQYSSTTAEEKAPAFDITSLSGRTGLCCKILPDNMSVVVGSLTHFVNNKGKGVPNGYDLSAIPNKSKYSLECCGVSTKFIAASLSTLDFGGRSVYLVILNTREKKAVKSIEALQFRFGGSSSFGIKCCAISPSEKYVAGCIKDSNKNQLKVNIWGFGKWSILFSTNIIGESISNCFFSEGNTVVLDVKDKNDVKKSLGWNYEALGEAAAIGVENGINTSANHPSKSLCASWNKNNNNAQIAIWKKGEKLEKTTGSKHRINGVVKTNYVLVNQNSVVFLGEKDHVMKIYNLSEIEPIQDGSPQLCDMNSGGLVFLPKSDNSVIVNKDTDVSLSIFNCDSITSEAVIKKHAIPAQEVTSNYKQNVKIFKGASTSSQTCFVSSDGASLVLNLGNNIIACSNSDGSCVSLKPSAAAENHNVLMCFVSPKELLVCVVYEENPAVVVIYDLKYKQQVRKLCTDEETSKAYVTDMTVMPHGGHIITYHRSAKNKLMIWNQRTGKYISSDSRKINFGCASLSLDRLLLVCVESDGNTDLILRNSDNKFNTTLSAPDEWPLRTGSVDADFSPDGTILIGVETRDSACRVWNAANGEVLKDINVKFKGIPSVVGMPTNTHVVLYDERLQVIDVGSGDVTCIAPLSGAKTETSDERNIVTHLQVSPRGNIIAGFTRSGRILMWRCHNLTAIKRKTTLQRIKSVS